MTVRECIKMGTEVMPKLSIDDISIIFASNSLLSPEIVDLRDVLNTKLEDDESFLSFYSAEVKQCRMNLEYTNLILTVDYYFKRYLRYI